MPNICLASSLVLFMPSWPFILSFLWVFSIVRGTTCFNILVPSIFEPVLPNLSSSFYSLPLFLPSKITPLVITVPIFSPFILPFSFFFLPLYPLFSPSSLFPFPYPSFPFVYFFFYFFRRPDFTSSFCLRAHSSPSPPTTLLFESEGIEPCF